MLTWQQWYVLRRTSLWGLRNERIVGLSFFFLIGAACPLALWLFTRRHPNTILNYLKWVLPVFFLSLSQVDRILIQFPVSIWSTLSLPYQDLILACPSPWCSLIFNGVGQIPPATAVNYVPWAIIGFFFQYVVRRKHFSYWAKYNCMSLGILHP